MHARLLRVQFPRVKVDAALAVFMTIDELNRPLGIPVRQKAEVSTASNWGSHVPQQKRGHGKFRNRARVREYLKGSSDHVRHAVVRMPDGEDTRVVRETKLSKNFERPQRFSGNRKTRGTITMDHRARAVFKKLLGNSGIFAELFRRHFIDGAVAKTVAGDLMAAVGHLPDNTGAVFNDPSKSEKCRLATSFVKEIEEKIGGVLDPALLRIPLCRSNLVLKSADVIVVFEIDCERVSHGQPLP